jgi:hypothetical protein
MLALSRDLGPQYNAAFVLAHEMREAMASEMRGARGGGEGRKAEIDGANFGVTYGRMATGRSKSCYGGACYIIPQKWHF